MASFRKTLNTFDEKQRRKSSYWDKIDIGVRGRYHKDDWFSKLYYRLPLTKSKRKRYTPAEFEDAIQKLHKYCLTHLEDSYKVHLYRLKGVQLIEEITYRAGYNEIKNIHIMSMVWCVLSCCHHFYVRLRIGNSLFDFPRRQQARKAIFRYETVVDLASRDFSEICLQAVLTFFTESGMWSTEYLCSELLQRLMYINRDSEKATQAVLDTVEKLLSKDVKNARLVMSVLNSVLKRYKWEKISESLIVRLLAMFYKSIVPDDGDDYQYAPLQKIIEVCVRNVLENIPNKSLLTVIKILLSWSFNDDLEDEALLDFGNVLEYAAMLHETMLYNDSLHFDLFPLVLKLVASDDRLRSLLGNRVFQHLLDRHENKVHFETPRIYFEKTHYAVNISLYNSEDRIFMRKYREMIHATLLAAIQQHGVNVINLESTFTSIAILCVEIPCGYTAAAVVCLAMAIQEDTIMEDNMELPAAHRIHATVMGLMSLVCWIHEAKVFYEYLNTVVARRAQFAPHLNPPLRLAYEYAEHHILWNKPDLFFEDWEARYGLWKCFRSGKQRVGSASNIIGFEDV